MNIFFDTNILLDIALRREPHFKKSGEIFSEALQDHRCFMSWHSVSNLYYILGKFEGRSKATLFIKKMTTVCKIASVGHDDLAVAFRYDNGDLEDSMQIAAALNCNAEIIMTRDPKGFAKSPILISTSNSN